MNVDPACEDQQAAYLEGDAQARQHVATCPTCGPMRDDLDAVATLIDDPALWEEPGAGLEDRIMADVLAVAGAGPAVAPPPAGRAAEPGAEPGAAAAAAVSLAEARARRDRRRMRVPVWVPLAAAAASAVVAGIATDRAGAPPRPDQTVALAPTELAGDAIATASLRRTDSGVEVRLDVRDLPRPDDGAYYQAWIAGPDGLVAIGTFHTGASEIILWSGVEPAPGATLSVTLEPDDGNPASSGRRVFAATLP